MTTADNSELLGATLARFERGDDPFDAQGHAAFDCVRKFMFEHVPEGFSEGLDEEAIALVGEPEEKVGAAIERLAREAHALFGAIGMKESTQFAFSLALAQIVRERIAELQARGVGRA